jgi:methylmalonyl-CoA mutase
MAEPHEWDAWRALAEKALGGAPFDTLRTTMDDGRGGTIVLEPLSPPAEPVFAGRPKGGRWSVVARVDADDGAAAQALEDLENGASALSLVFAGAPSAFGRGLTAADPEELDRALGGVDLGLIALHIEAGARGREALALVAALCHQRAMQPLALHAGLDPIGAYAAGAPLRHWLGRTSELADVVRGYLHLGFDGTALVADGRILGEAGASPVQELAFAIGAFAEYLTVLDREGLPPATVLPRIAIALTATHDQFATVAKLRAARRLHRLVADACGVEVPLALHVTTARRMLAVSDPYTNLIRLTIAAFAAGIGGADAVTVLPFDAAASPFGRRMARNIQNLLLEEAHVARMEDAGAGSGTVEAITDAFAEAAWRLFQSRAKLSLAELVRTGALAAEIVPSEPVIIGVTRHPPATRTGADDVAPVTPPRDRRGDVAGDGFGSLLTAAFAGASIADLEATVDHESPAPAEPVLATRASAPYEAA